MSSEAKTAEVGPFPGQLGYHTSKAIERLKHGKPGDTVTRAQMAEVIGRGCGNGELGAGNVNQAIKHVQTNYAVVWRWSKPAQCWQCLNADQAVEVERKTIEGGKRRIRSAMRLAKVIDNSALSKESAVEHQLNVMAAGMMLTAGSAKFRKRLSEKGTDGMKEPDSTALLTLFK